MTGLSPEYDVTVADVETRLRTHLAATTGGLGSADLNVVLAEAARDGARLGLQFAIGVILGALPAGDDQTRILDLLRERRDHRTTPGQTGEGS